MREVYRKRVETLLEAPYIRLFNGKTVVTVRRRGVGSADLKANCHRHSPAALCGHQAIIVRWRAEVSSVMKRLDLPVKLWKGCA